MEKKSKKSKSRATKKNKTNKKSRNKINSKGYMKLIDESEKKDDGMFFESWRPKTVKLICNITIMFVVFLVLLLLHSYLRRDNAKQRDLLIQKEKNETSFYNLTNSNNNQ